MTSSVRPGKTVIHHFCGNCWPLAMSEPSDGVGGLMPKPRNESAASTMIAAPTDSVPLTTIGPSVFGRMCRNMMRMSPEPAAFAASTYSFSRSDRNTPRTMRARPVQKKSARITDTRHCDPWPSSAAAVSRIASAGSVRTRSVMRMRMLSIQPP